MLTAGLGSPYAGRAEVTIVGMTRAQLTGIAKELGCWGKGKPISMEMGTAAMEVALRSCRPSAAVQLSAEAAAFFEAVPYAPSVGSGQPGTAPPKPNPFLGTGPASPVWPGGSSAVL